MNVCIIGAGPAGMTAAYQLAKTGIAVEVFEAGDSVGGMARTLDLWGQKADIGPHRFFSSDPRINKVWLEVAAPDYDMVNRLTRIFYRGRLFFYPLKPFNALANLGLFEAARCLLSYAAERLHPTPMGETPTFEEWVVSRFGRRLFGIFFKTYSEKLWGISCSELDADFAAQRIKKFSLGEAIWTALGLGKTQHKTLVDQFAYPHGGTGMVYERMAQKCIALGGKIHLKTPVRRVVVEKGRAVAVELENGQRLAYDHIISTMPMTHLVERMDGAPAEVLRALHQLTYRNTILVFLRIPAKDLFRDNWLYVHSADLQTGRITNFRNWTPHLYGKSEESIVAMEYWCYDSEALWKKTDEELIALATDEIQRSHLLPKGQAVTAGHVERIGRSYPVYARGYKKPLSVVENFLRTIGALSVIGRYGAFKYNNQDHSILMGILAAENIRKGALCHDLWDINTDYEYQESSVITSTGLQESAAP